MISGYRRSPRRRTVVASNIGRGVMKLRIILSKIVLAAAVAATLPVTSLAQPGGPGKGDGPVRVPCCTCVDGTTKSVALATGTHAWSVSGPGVSGSPNAVGVSQVAGWAALAGAAWVAPSTSASSDAPAGTYTYTVRFQAPRCVIGGRMMLKGKAGGDNRVTVLLDGNQIGATPGSTQYGFQAANFATFNAPVTSAGTHTLTVRVDNEGGPTGMVAQATLEMQCPKGAELGNS